MNGSSAFSTIAEGLRKHLNSLGDAIGYLALWGSIGAALFSLFVLFVFRSGIVYTARNEDGSLKDRIPWSGYATMASFLLSVVGFFVLANYLGLVRDKAALSFGSLFQMNLALYFVLFLFDTLVIDAFVLGHWRPSFLKLSAQLGRDSMRKHILKSIPVGIAVGIPLSGLVSTIAFFGLM